jgi:hypothetical protein
MFLLYLVSWRNVIRSVSMGPPAAYESGHLHKPDILILQRHVFVIRGDGRN